LDGTNQWIETTNQTGCRLYIVLDTPTAPQTQPWKGVLDIACDVAWGRSDASGAMYALWEDFKWVGTYDTVLGGSRYLPGTSFLLTTWLTRYPDCGTVNCHDMGGAIAIFANALGCGASCTEVAPFGYLNCIKPIGCGWANNPFYDYPGVCPDPIMPGNSTMDSQGRPRTLFSSHAFATSSDGVIYDASGVYVDGDWDPDDWPCLRGLGLCQYNWDDYRPKVIDDNPAPPYGTGSPSLVTFSVQ